MPSPTTDQWSAEHDQQHADAAAAAVVAHSTGARPYRSSSGGPASRPAVIAVTKIAKPRTPTQCAHVVAVDQGERRASRWPTPRPRRTPAPSARSPACAAPARRSGPAACASWLRLGGEERRDADVTQQHQRDHADHRQVQSTGTPSAVTRTPIAGADDRAEAPAGVEPRHDRPPEPLLDRRALHVHGDVPDAGADAVGEQAERWPPTDPADARRRAPRPPGRRATSTPPSRTTDAALERWISQPLDGSASTEPAAIASSSSPSAPLPRSRSPRTSGNRGTRPAKQKPLSDEDQRDRALGAFCRRRSARRSGRSQLLGRAGRARLEPGLEAGQRAGSHRQLERPRRAWSS